MASWLLLISVTVLYSGYNLLIKVSASHVPEAATTTIQATICLQLAALATFARLAQLDELPPTQTRQARLSVRRGGMGLRSLHERREAAWVGSGRVSPTRPG